jgi:hypothetical protein
LRLIEDLVEFARKRVYVLDFSDSSFSEFFAAELDVDVDGPTYAEHGGSKGKRLRCFLQKVDATLRAPYRHSGSIVASGAGTDRMLGR